MDIDVSELRAVVEGTIDFEGQKKAASLINTEMWAGASLSFLAMLISDRFQVLVVGLAVTLTVAFGLCLPWPSYRKHDVKWANAQ